jgi:hypothetical protein
MITFVTCWYKFNNKFNDNIYKEWIDNFLSNVNNFYLVVYTNKDSYIILEKYSNLKNIKIIIEEVENFSNYQYKNYWIINHEKNYLLNSKISWEVNMLWNEKIAFVKKTFENNYFNTEWFGWCDIGYFRCRNNDLSREQLKLWPNIQKIKNLNKDKIYYAKVNNNSKILNNYMKIILDKNDIGLPKLEIPHNQVSIAGGFFIIHKDKINWYYKLNDNKLKLYFNNNRLVKDDQIIVLNNIIDNLNNFQLISENDKYDNWFLFQRFLL